MGEWGNATLHVLCAPVLPHFPGREMRALAVFPGDGGSEMKGRVIYKYIKNECIYEVLFSRHSPLAIVATLRPSAFAYKALQNSHEIAFIPFDCRSAANAGSKQTVSLITAVSSCLLSCDRRRPGQQRGLAEHGGRRRPGKREEAQQEERDLSEGGHQHHEGVALPAPNGQSFSPLALLLMCPHHHTPLLHNAFIFI